MVGKQRNSQVTFPEQPQLFSLTTCPLQQGRSVPEPLVLTFRLSFVLLPVKVKNFFGDIQITGMKVTNILCDKHSLLASTLNFE